MKDAGRSWEADSTVTRVEKFMAVHPIFSVIWHLIISWQLLPDMLWALLINPVSTELFNFMYSIYFRPHEINMGHN